MDPAREDFTQFLQNMAVGVDGSSRKNSPGLNSPLPPTPGAPPTGETKFKQRQSRHVKMNSQPILVNLDVLRKEHDKSKERAEEDSRRRESAEERPKDSDRSRDVETKDDERRVDIEKVLRLDEPTAAFPSSTGDDASKQKKVPGGLSLKKTLQRMALSRTSTDKSTASSPSSLRPRSPSKDSTLGTRRRALVAKLGMGKFLSKKESDERFDDSELTNFQLNTSSPDLGSTPYTEVHAQMKSASMKPAASMPYGGNSSSSSVSTSSNAPTDRRSSAPMNAANILSSDSAPQHTGDDRSKRAGLTVEETKDKEPPSGIRDLSPVFLTEKNHSASALQMGNSVDQAGASSNMQMEQQKMKKDHLAFEIAMAKTTNGALTIARTVNQRQKRSSLGQDGTSGGDEAIRIAALTLQARNDQRMRELVNKLPALEARNKEVESHANRIKESLLEPCRQLVQVANHLKDELTRDHAAMQQEIANTERKIKIWTEEASWIDEKISNALELKRKVFTDKIKDAQERLYKLRSGELHAGQSGWLVTIIDHGFHSLMELVLLGGGTLLSVLSSIFVMTRTCCGRRGKRTAVKRKSSSS